MKHYKFIFLNRRSINAICPYCGFSCSGNDEYAESVRKTVSYFHRICVQQYIRKEEKHVARLHKYYNINMDNMSGIEVYLMKKQRKAMAEYRNALRKRIEFYKGKEGIK